MSHWATDSIYLAAVHSIAGIVGFFYRLFLSNKLGPQGMGIYQQTLAFYFTAITIITAGIPLSVSKLLAENRNDSKTINQIITSAYMLTTFFSILGSLYLIILSITMKRFTLLLVLPASILVGLSSVLKGYFLGLQETVPVRWSIIAESIIRTVLGAFFVKNLLLIGLEPETRGALTALTIGELISLLVLMFFFRKNSSHSVDLKVGNMSGIKKILQIAVPVSLSQIIGSISGSAEALLIPKSLAIAGLSANEALAVYGKTTGMALPLLFFPAILIGSISSNLIPQISMSLAQKDSAYAFRLSEQALAFSSFFSFCVAGSFISLAKPIAELVFKGFELDVLLIGFGSGIPFFYIDHILASLLRATGNNKVPLINSFLSLVVTNSILCLLVSKPFFGILGYAIALITASALSNFIGINALEKTFNKRFNLIDIFIKPLLSCVLMTFIIFNTFEPLSAMDMPAILCILGALFLGFTGYLALGMSLGISIIPFRRH